MMRFFLKKVLFNYFLNIADEYDKIFYLRIPQYVGVSILPLKLHTTTIMVQNKECKKYLTLRYVAKTHLFIQSSSNSCNQLP